MEPMSSRKRMFYFVFFAILFVIAVPSVIFHALGYRFDYVDSLISERGGMYVYSQIPGTKIYVNDEFVDETGIFNREYDTQSLKPGKYSVRAENEEYRTWEKYVTVYPKKVSSLYPFLLPSEFELQEIPQYVSSATSTEDVVEVTVAIDNKEYLDTVSMFSSNATTTMVLDVDDEIMFDKSDPDVIRRIFGNVEVSYKEGDFYAHWTGRGDWMPSYFCENGECLNPINFLTVNGEVSHFDFYPGRDDVIIFSVNNGGIYVAEVDKRPKQIVTALYEGADVNFIIQGKKIFIKDGVKLFTLEL